MPKKNSGTFCYPGSKTTLGPWIVDHFPEHDVYVEPFGGSASTFMFKPRSPAEVYNDINDHCVTFFNAIKNHADELSEWVDTTPYSRELFETWRDEFKRGDVPDDPVEHAGRFWFLQMASFGGKLPEEGGYFAVDKQKPINDPSYKPLKWQRKSDHVHNLKDRFNKVQIESQDYRTVVERYDSKETLFYFDPPYVDVDDDYYSGERFSHQTFVETLADISGHFVASYDTLPSGLDDYAIVSRRRSWTMTASDVEGTEKLVMNFDTDGEPLMSDVGQQSLEAFGGDGR